MSKKVVTLDRLNYFYQSLKPILENKVDSSGDKVLSDNNFDNTHKINCNKIPTIERTITTIQSSIADLQFVPVTVNTFTCTPATAEKGSTASVELAWTTNKAPTTLKINGTDVTGSSITMSGVTTDQTYTITATDTKNNTSTKTASVVFVNQVYYGAATNSNSITTLTKVLSGNKARDVTVNAGAGEYVYYAYPKRLGTATFHVSGFEGGFVETAETKSLVNESGFAEDYYVYRSTNASLGNTTVTVK